MNGNRDSERIEKYLRAFVLPPPAQSVRDRALRAGREAWKKAEPVRLLRFDPLFRVAAALVATVIFAAAAGRVDGRLTAAVSGKPAAHVPAQRPREDMNRLLSELGLDRTRWAGLVPMPASWEPNPGDSTLWMQQRQWLREYIEDTSLENIRTGRPHGPENNHGSLRQIPAVFPS